MLCAVESSLDMDEEEGDVEDTMTSPSAAEGVEGEEKVEEEDVDDPTDDKLCRVHEHQKRLCIQQCA